jgi:hypothetical protein
VVAVLQLVLLMDVVVALEVELHLLLFVVVLVVLVVLEQPDKAMPEGIIRVGVQVVPVVVRGVQQIYIHQALVYQILFLVHHKFMPMVALVLLLPIMEMVGKLGELVVLPVMASRE